MFVTDKDYGVACDQKWRQHFRALVLQERCRPRAEALKYNCHHTPRCFHIRYIIVNSVCIRAETHHPHPTLPTPRNPPGDKRHTMPHMGLLLKHTHVLCYLHINTMLRLTPSSDNRQEPVDNRHEPLPLKNFR